MHYTHVWATCPLGWDCLVRSSHTGLDSALIFKGQTVPVTLAALSCSGQLHTLKEKRALKQCPLGTILKNGAFFGKKGTILVPLGHQNGVVPPNKTALLENVWGNSALSESGTETVPQKVPFYGRSNGAPRAPFWCHLFFWVQLCPDFLPVKTYCWGHENAWVLMQERPFHIHTSIYIS